VHVVTRGHFRSCDKDGGYTIRSAIAENPMLHANFVALCFIEQELLPMEVLHRRNRDFRPFYSCDLDLDRMTYMNLTRILLRCTECAKMNLLRQGFQKFSSDRQTYGQKAPKLYAMPLRGWPKNINFSRQLSSSSSSSSTTFSATQVLTKTSGPLYLSHNSQCCGGR